VHIEDLIVSIYQKKGGAVMSDRAVDFLKGMIVGSIIGGVIGVLYAPKSGKETREDIGRKANELMEKAKDEYELALEKSRKAYEAASKRLKALERSTKEKVEEIEGRIGGMVEEGREALHDNKSRLKKAIDAGIETFKEEKGKSA
jgi:gas vesicle protein